MQLQLLWLYGHLRQMQLQVLWLYGHDMWLWCTPLQPCRQAEDQAPLHTGSCAPCNFKHHNRGCAVLALCNDCHLLHAARCRLIAPASMLLNSSCAAPQLCLLALDGDSPTQILPLDVQLLQTRHASINPVDLPISRPSALAFTDAVATPPVE